MKNIGFFTLLIIIVNSFLLTGCSMNSDMNVKQIERDGVVSIIMGNDAKSTYIKQHGHIDRFCASRESDSDRTFSESGNVGVGSLSQNEMVGGEVTDGALSLGGRSPTVLITREMMYRACEMSMNLNTDKENTIKIYKMFIDAVKDISRIEHDKGSKGVAAIPRTPSYIKNSKSENEENDEDNDD